MLDSTKIICTIGPSTDSETMLRKLVKAGMDVARLNFSHGTIESHIDVIQKIQKINKSAEVPVAILVDTQGPEIRTTKTKEGNIILRKGDTVKIVINKPTCSVSKKEHIIGIDYKYALEDIKPKQTLLLDNGFIHLKVTKKESTHLVAKCINSGVLKDRKHVNLPGVDVQLPTMTTRDKKLLDATLKQGIDYVALSFVRHAQDIVNLRRYIHKRCPSVKIIAKIEHPRAVENLDEIITHSDGVMIARGDLAIEMPYEEIPIIQRNTVKQCIEHGKPVIVATQMLESMVDSPFPTRAEITDIANAVSEKADATMLSGETTTGNFPVECVQTMSKISRKMGQSLPSYTFHHRKNVTRNQEIARSACLAATNLEARAILVFTSEGHTALNISNFRPKTEIYAFSQKLETCRRVNLFWGIIPCCLPKNDDPEKLIQAALEHLQKKRKLKKKDLVVIVSDSFHNKERVNTIQVRMIH